MKTGKWITLAVIMFCIYSCADDEFPVMLSEAQVERLLTADSSKVWFPNNANLFPECALDNKYTFISKADEDELDSIEIDFGLLKACPNDPIADEGNNKFPWELEAAGEHYNLTLDTTTYRIDLLTASRLELTNSETEAKLTFSDKEPLIVD